MQSNLDPLQQLRSEPLRTKDPFDYDKIMGIYSVGPFFEEGDERELTDVDSQPSKPLKGSVPRLDSDTGVGGIGVGEGSRGYGSASFLEVLRTQRATRLEIPAACASQGALEFLRTEQSPRQVMSPHSSSNLPQSFFGTYYSGTFND